MIAVDTNILVYAHRSDAPLHAPAAARIKALAEGRAPWAIPWPCVHEFLAIVTHPRIFRKPTPVKHACDQVTAWTESPYLVLLGEEPDYWSHLTALLGRSQVRGPKIHDARIAALVLQHGVDELWSADRDFGKFAGLAVRNPLI